MSKLSTGTYEHSVTVLTNYGTVCITVAVPYMDGRGLILSLNCDCFSYYKLESDED
jgi:hypothetical protein